MNVHRTFTQLLLEEEAVAWRDLAPADYDRALCRMLDDLRAAPPSADRSAALVALTSATLRREGRTITESRACAAEHLLALTKAASDPTPLLRLHLLFFLAWLRLGEVVERGPEFISVAPELPPGVVGPDGMNLAAIHDPALREQAREAAVRHAEAVERWNAKQRALGHLNRLATLALAARPTFKDDESVTKELWAAMSLAPGVPTTLRRSLEDHAR